MNRLFSVVAAGLFLAVFTSGCFESEVDETCVGAACESNVILDDDPTTIPDDPVEQPDDPVDDPKPVEEDPVAIGLDLVQPVTAPVHKISHVLGNPYVKVEEPPVVDEGVTIEDLSPEELATVDTLRTSIEFGLDVGRVHYLEAISLALQSNGILPDYETLIEEGSYGLDKVPEECPFAKFYDNGFTPTGYACDYLADMAKVEVYSELSGILDSYQLPPEVQQSPDFDEALFWYEQGAVSGVEEERVIVRTDMKDRKICTPKPTPKESSVEKGNLVGRQLLQKEINGWLSASGYYADYPTMSKPIQVCNANVSMLNPAKTKALQGVETEANNVPLCDQDYQPPTQEGMQQWAQAEIDYRKAIKLGVEDEFSLAAVKVFKVIPCNVSDPLVIDLDGDGFDLLPIHKGVNFDLYGTGMQAVAWVASDDGFLAYDANNDGVVNGGSELFGNLNLAYADGFAHLASLDMNGDNAITPVDAGFASLVVWKDTNSDGVSTSNEVVPLSAFGVSSVSLAAATADSREVPKVSSASGAGFSMAVGDAFLRSAPYARLAR